MEIANLLGKLKGQEKDDPKQFLALALTDELVQASVWSVVSEQTEILAIGTPVDWDGETGTTTELITAVDATISSALEGIDQEPTEVILGVPYSWTDKNGILGVKKELIQKISQELELKPIGYVSITDSILTYLRMQEGTPTTSILIQVSRDELTLALVKLGRTESIEVVTRGDDIVEDVTEGVARFKSHANLPSRIILFNSMHDLDEITQNLLSISWQEDFNFLHTPKIEALAKDVVIRALSLAGGSEVAKSLGIALSPPLTIETPTPPAIPPVESREKPALLSAKDIGFTSPPPASPPSSPVTEPEISTPDAPTKAPITSKLPTIALPKLSLPSFKLKLPQLGGRLWLLAGGALALIGLIFSLIWFLPKATIIVSVTPKPLDHNLAVTLSTTASELDFNQQIIPASLESLSASGELSQETTGTKIIGDPAEGEVVLYNRTSSVKNFPSGTVITANSLKFTLDEDVNVASKSAGSDYVDVPGKAKVSVTAVSIGQDSNLPSGTEFTIANFGKDTFVAKNEDAFVGGTSEEVAMVSKEDHASLANDLTSRLLEELQSQVSSQSETNSGIYLIQDSLETLESNYSADIAQAASSVSLSLKVSVTALKYQIEDVTTLANSAIDSQVPDGFIKTSLPPEIDLEASDIAEDEQSVTGTAYIKVAMVPVLPGDLPQLLAGKKGLELESLLQQAVPGYQNTLVEHTPKFPRSNNRLLPLNSKNIKIVVTPI